MEAKEAIERAKIFLLQHLGEEGIKDLGLEEIELDDAIGGFFVTLGFTRPWDNPPPSNPLAQVAPIRRTYKVIHVSPGGSVLSMKNREVNV